MKFLRTASTRRLLAVMAGLVLAVAIGSAIAVAATSGGPVPKRQSLADAVHQALSAPAVKGISARIQFTNGLIASSDVQGSDPILTGATGRLWLTDDHQMRLELQSSGNGNTGQDAQVVVTKTSWWVYDPMTNTKYQGTIPSPGGPKPGKSASHSDKIPTVAQIQTQINQALSHLNIAGPNPTDIAGHEAYTVRISPKHDGGLLGAVQLGWDALRGVPLKFGLYAKGSSTPVLELAATQIHYGAIPASDLQASAPAGAKVVTVQTPASTPAPAAGSSAAHPHHPKVTGPAAVQKHLSFKLAAPAKLVGLPRQSVGLLDWAGTPAALVSYGQGLGGIAVIEQPAASGSTGSSSASGSGSGGNQGLSLPTVSIDGTSAQELATPIGTVLRLTHGKVAYTVLGSVQPFAAEQAARSLVG